MSFPFFGKEFIFTQPDGTELKVRGWGDQYHAVFETLDGYTVVEDPVTHFYTFAALSGDNRRLHSTGINAAGAINPDNLGLERNVRIPSSLARARAFDAFRIMGRKRRCDIRREQHRRFMYSRLMGAGPAAAPPRREVTGQYRGLCLLVQFPDVAGTIPKEEVEQFCNKDGYNGYGNNGSVYNYFYDNSGGKLEYRNEVTSYFTLPHRRLYYSNTSIPYGDRARELIVEALTNLKEQGYDFTNLSADSGGYVYAVNVYYAGTCPNGWGKGLWPHSYCLEEPFELCPGRYAYDYQLTDIGNQLTLATFCHENGHMVCDFPDLYDYGYESKGVGLYCLMSGGGRQEKNPSQISAYLKYKAGWSDEVIPVTDGMAIDLPADKNQFLLYPKSETEYFIVENRVKSGRDASLPASGLAVWHVDETGSNNYEDMEENLHYECSLEQADNKFDLEEGRNSGDRTDLYHKDTNTRFADSTAPNSKWWDGTPSGLDIYDIGKAGASMTAKARVFAEDKQVETYRLENSPAADIPDNDDTGIRDTLRFPDAAVIISMQVEVDITHTYRGDLLVTLTSPGGEPVILHRRSGGSKKDLKQTYETAGTSELRVLTGKDLQGNWTLLVQDLAELDKGRLNRWAIEAKAVPRSAATLEESPGVTIPDNSTQGIQRTLSADADGTVKHIEVELDITHSYIRDLVVTLTSPDNTTVDLHRRQGGSADNIIGKFTPETTPALANLLDHPVRGPWKLSVADLAGLDVGKLNRWALYIQME